MIVNNTNKSSHINFKSLFSVLIIFGKPCIVDLSDNFSNKFKISLLFLDIFDLKILEKFLTNKIINYFTS